MSAPAVRAVLRHSAGAAASPPTPQPPRKLHTTKPRRRALSTCRKSMKARVPRQHTAVSRSPSTGEAQAVELFEVVTQPMDLLTVLEG